jgi:hypothetical protein
MKKIGMHKEAEFDHPLINKGDPLERHVLYKLRFDYKFAGE